MKFRLASSVAGLVVIFAVPAKGQSNAKPGGDSTPFSLKLPRGWKATEKTPEREGTLFAWQSEDNTSSLFVSTVRTDPSFTLQQVLDEVVGNFEKALIVNRIGETKTGELAGVSMVFTTLKIDLPSATTAERKSFRFYLTVFQMDGVIYLIQGSVQSPVKPEREREIMAIIRSLARK